MLGRYASVGKLCQQRSGTHTPILAVGAAVGQVDTEKETDRSDDWGRQQNSSQCLGIRKQGNQKDNQGV